MYQQLFKAFWVCVTGNYIAMCLCFSIYGVRHDAKHQIPKSRALPKHARMQQVIRRNYLYIDEMIQSSHSSLVI